jgi:hypothetical protein
LRNVQRPMDLQLEQPEPDGRRYSYVVREWRERGPRVQPA